MHSFLSSLMVFLCGTLIMALTCSSFAETGNAPAQQLEKMVSERNLLSATAAEFKSRDPDFADWLSQQPVILSRLEQCIRDDFKNNPRRATSELEDFRYLLDRIAAEIDFVKKAPDLQVGGCYNVRDFGARGDGIADDGPAVRKAVAAATAPGSTKRMVFLPKGKYLIQNDPNNKPYSRDNPKGNMFGDSLVLDGLQNLLLTGEEGTEIITPYVFGASIKVGNCNNVRVKNLRLVQKIRPYTTGVITGFSGNASFDVTIDKNMPAPTEPYFKDGLSFFKGLMRFYSQELQKDGVAPKFSSIASHVIDPGIAAISGNRYRFTIREPSPVNAFYSKGMRFVLFARSHPFGGIVNGHSERSRFENIRMDSSSNLAFFNNSSDMFFIVGCKVEGAPGSFQSANSDGIYTSNSTLGGYVAKNTIRHLGDDFINIHSYLRPANRQEGNVIYIPSTLDEWLLKRSRRIGFIAISKSRMDVADEVKIKSYEVVENGTMYKVTCDRPLNGMVSIKDANGKAPDMLVLMENQCHGCVIKDNFFGDGASRIIAGGRNWIFRNNTINDTLAWVVLFQISPENFDSAGSEGITPRNIIIADNQFRSVSKTMFRMRWGSPVSNYNLIPSAAEHILIENNQISLHGGSGRPPFELEAVDGVVIRNNRIITANKIDAPVFLAGQGKNITIKGNVIGGVFGSLTENAANINFQNNQIRIPGVKTPRP